MAAQSDAPLTLQAVAADPHLLTWMVTLPSGEVVTVRPLVPDDVAALGDFLAGLPAETRHFWHLASYDGAQAQALCAAIARYDKLRFVVTAQDGASHPIVGLLEFSLDLTEDDRRRYAGYGIDLVAGRDCRFGPCLAAAYQGKGIGPALFPYMVEAAQRFGRDRILLWGGVLATNVRAIRFYDKLGFLHGGSFTDAGGAVCHDMLYWIDDQAHGARSQT